MALPQKLRAIVSLNLQVWTQAEHPDTGIKEYILRGLQLGFRIGFQHGKGMCTSAKSNMLSANQNPGVVDEYLQKEVRLGRVIGPMVREELPAAQVSRFGVIEKPHQPGKYHLIVDLSHPEGHSVNDGIEPDLCTLKYMSVDAAVATVLSKRVGVKLAKFDIESAYRIIPVHPNDRSLLGMVRKGQLYIDTVLPFGLRSAPKIFSAVADALQWILEQEGVETLHYLDDFLVYSEIDSGEGVPLQKALDQCSHLGVPIATHKTEGPSTTITFVGIELATVTRTLHLPTEKLARLQKEVKEWGDRRCCPKRGLQSLIGQLQHATCVVRPGRTFLRRMIALLAVAKKPHHRNA